MEVLRESSRRTAGPLLQEAGQHWRDQTPRAVMEPDGVGYPPVQRVIRGECDTP